MRKFDFLFYQCDLSCGNDVVLGAEVNAVLSLLHPANHGARKVDPPTYIDTYNVCRVFYINNKIINVHLLPVKNDTVADIQYIHGTEYGL
jgi:hypothetical protein